MDPEIKKMIVHLGTTILVPLMLGLLTRLFPFKALFRKDTAEFEVLRKRNAWIDGIAGVLCLAGIWSGVVLYQTILESDDWWGIGFAFGWAVIAPVIWITAVTLPRGRWRLSEFWHYYEIKYKIGLRGIKIIYTPLFLIGILSTYVIFSR